MFNTSIINLSASNISVNSITLNTTNILGNIQINSSSGTAGQVLTSNGNSAPTWTTIAGGWVGTATSDLNMGIYNISSSTLDNSGGRLTIGANNTSLLIGKGGVTTNILGNIQINSSSGTAGQVLTSNGNTSTPSWTTITGGWVGTATSDLNMGIYNISSSTLDNSGGRLTIGEHNTSLTIGNDNTLTNILGNLQINSSSGTAGQVLTSNGNTSTPSWTTIAGGGGWVGTATSQLNMGIYNISTGTIDNSGGRLTIGANNTSLLIGKGGVTTNILGNLQINSSSGVSGYVLTSNGNTSTATWSALTPTWVPTATSNLNMSFFNISNILRLVLQTNVARAELYVQDGTDVIQIVPTQIAVRQGSRQIVLLPTGFVMNNAGGETTTRYNADGILTVVTSAGASPFNISTSSGLKLQNISGTIGQVVTADSGGNARWQNAPFVGTATSNLSMGTNLITATTTIGITKPLLPSYTYAVNTGTATSGSIGQIIKLTSSPTQNVTNSTLTAITGLNYQISAGVWYVSVQLTPYNPSTTTTTTYPRLVFNIGSGLTGNVNDDIATITDTNVVLGFVNTGGNQKVYTFGAMFSANATTFISASVLANTPTTPLPLQFQAASSILTMTRIA